MFIGSLDYGLSNELIALQIISNFEPFLESWFDPKPTIEIKVSDSSNVILG